MWLAKDMPSVLHRLDVVACSQLSPSAVTRPREVDRLAAELRAQGVLRHPLLVTDLAERRVVLDGNTRLAAALKLGLPDILIQTVPVETLPDPLRLPDLAVIGVGREEILRVADDRFHPGSGGNRQALRLALRPDEVLVMPEEPTAPQAIWETLRHFVTALRGVCDVVPLSGSPGRYLHPWPAAASAVLRPPPLSLERLALMINAGVLLPSGVLSIPVPRRILGINLSLTILAAPEQSVEKAEFVRDLVRLRISERRIHYYDAPIYVVEE
jgi:hypothetical protein